MIKNGLFLCSIGFLAFLYSVNTQTGQYNFLNMAISILLIGAGGYLFWQGHKKEQENKKKNGGVNKK